MGCVLRQVWGVNKWNAPNQVPLSYEGECKDFLKEWPIYYVCIEGAGGVSHRHFVEPIGAEMNDRAVEQATNPQMTERPVGEAGFVKWTTTIDNGGWDGATSLFKSTQPVSACMNDPVRITDFRKPRTTPTYTTQNNLGRSHFLLVFSRTFLFISANRIQCYTSES